MGTKREQAQQLCKDFLRMQKGRVFDPIQAVNEMAERWGVRVDWHEMSDALEYMVDMTLEADRITKSADGFWAYMIVY